MRTEKQMPDRYTYRVSWSEEDNEYVATCVEFPSLSHLAPAGADALCGIQALAADVVEDLRANGEPIPEPLSARTYSGHFVTRVPGELHRKLAIEAAEQGVSLNRLVATRLSAPPTGSPRPVRNARRR
jgi:predicted HicB family RNase H-like nuclease